MAEKSIVCPALVAHREISENNIIKKKDNEDDMDLRGFGRRTVLEEPSLVHIFFTYLCYTVLRWFGNLREFLRKTGIEKRKGAKDNNSDVSWVIPELGNGFLKVEN